MLEGMIMRLSTSRRRKSPGEREFKGSINESNSIEGKSEYSVGSISLVSCGFDC